MTAWMKQRDILVEQTMAFVKSVAATTPSFKAPAVAAAASPAVESDDLPVAVQAALMTATVAAQSAVVMPPKVDIAPAEPIFVVSERVPPQRIELPDLPERELIAQRVARFRAGQQALQARRIADYGVLQDRLRAPSGDR